MALPEISREKKEKSLEKARLVKFKRSEIKKLLKKDFLNIKELISKDSVFYEYTANMKIIDIIVALPGTGIVKARKILKMLNISEKKTLAGLGSNQIKSFKDFFKIF